MVLISIFCVILSSLDYSRATSYYATKKLPIYSVERDEKLVSISFDCAWGVDYTDKLLEEMAHYNVKCTFFPVKFWTEKYPDYVKKITDAGHEFGTHSSTHSYMSKLDSPEIIKELKESSEAIEKITGKKVTLFRPPYGDYNDRLINTARENGYEVIQWDVDSLANNLVTELMLRPVSKFLLIEGAPEVNFTSMSSSWVQLVACVVRIIKLKNFVPLSGPLINRGLQRQLASKGTLAQI